MKINKQGIGHYQDGVNNQDFFYEKENLKMVLDGCSAGAYTEIGTRLFVQLFDLLPEKFNVDSFEDNVKKIFDELLDKFSFWYKTQEELENFIMENLIFTIIACFETEDEFIVKLFGDGYIVTVNQCDRVSYMKHYYGRIVPYFVYRYCENNSFKECNFKTFTFSKKEFKKVGIATDGISPIATEYIKTNFDGLLTSKLDTEYSAEGIISANIQYFHDDVTILI